MQIYRYGLEDTDVDENGEEIFREMDSTFFCRIRDLFSNELKTMYNTLESQNAWHAESFINEADAWQAEFPEELWRLNTQRVYIRPYGSLNSATSATTDNAIAKDKDAQFLVNMANGRMKYQRRQWERSQEKYMASKYQTSLAANDNVVLRCAAPDGELVVPKNYKLKLTPYSYMYLNVQYSTGAPIQVKGLPNVEVEIPFSGDSTDIINIYSASILQSLGDLSTCYPTTVDAGKASKLKELTVGNSTEGYDNPYLTTLTTGANYLLEKLNVENVSGLTQSLNLNQLKNLKELCAHGSNISGVTFANGGAITTAELPAIGALSMKNLMYLVNLDIVSLDKLTTITVEECDVVDVKAMVEGAPNLNRVRITGIEWDLETTELLESIYEMAGIDKSGYNIAQSVLAGKVYVPTIKQQQLADYKAAWPDLEVTFGSMIEQFAVTFVNEDGTVLDVQYVDIGGSAVDPITREVDPIPVPTKESTVSTDFTFDKWDSVLTNVFSDRVVTATYTESTRSYTIKYVAKNITLQETSALYGEYVPYAGSTPTYTAEESAYKYNLFREWDKSGYVDGNKTINAIFDSFQYTDTVFEGKELSDLSPVAIYALNKLGADNVKIDLQEGDPYSITLGYDLSYEDVESEVIISERTVFDGTNYIDTGLTLFDEDRDFVLAIDYDMSSESPANSVLAQCFQSNGSNGFKLWSNSGVKFTWGTTSITPTAAGSREMIVIQHKKGSNDLTVYNSNMSATTISIDKLTRTKNTIANSTLVFGCMKADDGAYENYAVGNVYWAKIWYRDLGAATCEKLAGWVHETVNFELCGFKKYYLSTNSSKRCNFSLLATNLLSRDRRMRATSGNTGGWATSELNSYLNSRMYENLPTQIKAILQQVSIASSIGDQSTELSYSDCYISIPALIEVNNEDRYNVEPYVYEDSIISYMTSSDVRKRMYEHGTYGAYWLRSPNIVHTTGYFWRVDADGDMNGIGIANTTCGVLIEISF